MAVLEAIKGVDTGQTWSLTDRSVVLGRGPLSNVLLNDRRVSRSHCRVEYRDGEFVVVNLSQTNGTFVGGERVTDYVLKHGDEISVGDTTIRFVEASQAEQVDDGGLISTVVFVDDQLQEDDKQVIDLKFDSRQAAQEEVTSLDDALRKLSDVTQRFELVRSVGESVVSELDLDKIFNEILNHVFASVPAERGCVLLYDKEQDECVPRMTRERGRDTAFEDMTMSRTILETVMRERVAVLSTDAMRDHRFSGGESIIMQGIRAVMSAPMLFQDEILGVICIDSRSLTNAFSRRDLETFSVIANLAAMSIRNAQMVEERVQAETTRQNFARFLPPTLVKQITEEGRELQLGGQSIDVTILYSDIRSFTPMCEKRPPEEIVNILNTCFQEWTECIFRHGGTLDKYIGDAVLAVFGSPDPYPDHPLRAARAALEIRESMRNHPELFELIRTGTGLHRGDVIHGLIGSTTSMQYTVIGDTVNTAARMSKVAGSNQVVLSKSVQDSVGEMLLTKPLPPAVVQGKAEPIECYELLAVTPEDAAGAPTLSDE